MIPLAELKMVRSDEPLSSVFERMVDEDVDYFPVMDDGHFQGMGRACEHLLNVLRARKEVGLA